jgi:hypothetical protein
MHDAAEGDDALLGACRALMAPLARLAVSRGLRYAALDGLMRSAFVEAARAAHGESLPHRAVSRVSAATGLNRREVTRLMRAEPAQAARRSLASEAFTRWLTDPAYRRGDAARRSLPRQGAAPSFESLAQSVTKDMHPRSLLEEMGRLGLVRLDESRDAVLLQRDDFVPSHDEGRMLGFLAANVGDHLASAVGNVLSRGPRQLEQALFADELSVESIAQLQPLIRAQWQAAVQALVPRVQALLDEDAAADHRPRNQRLRVGMYAYSGPLDVVPPGTRSEGMALPPEAAGRSKKAR